MNRKDSNHPQLYPSCLTADTPSACVRMICNSETNDLCKGRSETSLTGLHTASFPASYLVFTRVATGAAICKIGIASWEVAPACQRRIVKPRQPTRATRSSRERTSASFPTPNMVAAAPPEEGVFRDGAFCITVEKMIALLSSTVSTPRPATCDSLELSLSKTGLANPSEEVLHAEKEN